MKKHRFLALTLLFTVSGCASISETFDVGEFHTQEFTDNYYRIIPAKYKQESRYTTVKHDINDFVTSFSYPTSSSAFDSMILSDIENNDMTLQEAVDLYGNEAARNLKLENFTSQTAFENAQKEAMKTSSNASWFHYANNNALAKGDFGPGVNDAFKKGIFSKLTDALILCDGTGSLVRIQIDENGMGQEFSHELIDYRNFVISLRGATNIDYAKEGIIRSENSKAKVEVEISFYIEKSTTSQAFKHSLNYTIDQLESDNNALVTISHFDLTKALPPATLKRVSGLSVNYKLLEHQYLKKDGVVNEEAEEEFAIMLYEIMLPHSSWR